MLSTTPTMISSEEDDAKNQQRDFAPVEQNPAHIQRNRQRHQTSAQSYEEGYRFATTHWHGRIVGQLGESSRRAGGRQCRWKAEQEQEADGRCRRQERQRQQTDNALLTAVCRLPSATAVCLTACLLSAYCRLLSAATRLSATLAKLRFSAAAICSLLISRIPFARPRTASLECHTS